MKARTQVFALDNQVSASAERPRPLRQFEAACDAAPEHTLWDDAAPQCPCARGMCPRGAELLPGAHVTSSSIQKNTSASHCSYQSVSMRLRLRWINASGSHSVVKKLYSLRQLHDIARPTNVGLLFDGAGRTDGRRRRLA